MTAFASTQIVFAQTQTIDKNGEKWVEQTLKSLTLREKIGQMVIVGMSGEFTNTTSEKFTVLRRHIEENKLGGFIISRGEDQFDCRADK